MLENLKLKLIDKIDAIEERVEKIDVHPLCAVLFLIIAILIDGLVMKALGLPPNM